MKKTHTTPFFVKRDTALGNTAVAATLFCQKGSTWSTEAIPLFLSKGVCLTLKSYTLFCQKGAWLTNPFVKDHLFVKDVHPLKIGCMLIQKALNSISQ